MQHIKDLKQFGFKKSSRTHVVAEIGINHGGDIEVAERLIISAARAGADSVKFQTYITEKRVPGKEQKAIFDILKKCELPFDAFTRLKECAEENSVEFFSTPFDEESIDFLESIDVHMHKVASFDVVNHAFLRRLADTKKIIIMSTGMANLSEIDSAYGILSSQNKNIALLHCVSSYPLKDSDANLAAIYELQGRYDCVIGYSDHTSGIEVPLLAVAAGAQVIEKHFKINEKMNCVDAPVSISEQQMRTLVEEIRRLESIFGDGELGMSEAEKGTAVFRRESH